MIKACPSCAFDLMLYPPREGNTCSNCGGNLDKENCSKLEKNLLSTTSLHSFFASFVRVLTEAILKPKEFFSHSRSDFLAPGGVSSALAFAVLVHWFAAFIHFVYRSLGGLFFRKYLSDLFSITESMMNFEGELNLAWSDLREQTMDFLFGAGTVVLSPFFTLFHILVISGLIHIAARLFLTPSSMGNMARFVRFSTTLKILCYASAPWVFCIIPGAGMLLAYILTFFIALFGIREVYQTTTPRATLILLFPELFVCSFLLVALFILLFVGFQILHLVF